MLNVLIKSSSRYPIRRKQIKQTIQKTLESLQLFGDFEVEVEIIGDRKMRHMKKQHFGIDETTDVLSFPLEETVWLNRNTPQPKDPFKFPDSFNHLGCILVSYPQAQRQANLHKLTTDKEINQLIEHGMLHLVGIHHE